MLRWSSRLDPEAHFVVGQAEDLPLPDASVDLITAAGSLNYANLDHFFPEAARVLRPGGVLAVYDFGQGTRSTDAPLLERWFAGFLRRYPPPACHARRLDPELLSAIPSGFRMDLEETFDVAVPLTRASYTDYILTEVNAADAMRRGQPEEDIRRWCDDTLRSVLGDATRFVLFPAYLACMVPVARNHVSP
jgi:SAM-dependent methyltransferase